MKLMLHACCGPCMTIFDKYFKEKSIDYSVYFYNPNIHPYKEYIKRMNTLKEYADSCGVESIIDESFMQSEWENKYNELPDTERCRRCYEIRIDKAAVKASKLGFTHFTTTLLVSPYQNHNMIRDICERNAKKHKIEFFYNDFRESFREGQQIAMENDLYRQKYCGCIYSFRESSFRDKITWD
jgi:predicted adenine nucleotide alpha hydrolase (AANH) superfamily ATPase